MIDYSEIIIQRELDRASPSHLNIKDRLRSWWALRNPRISHGSNIAFKENVEISICETGSLTIGDNSFFHANCWLLLTMPKPEVKIGRWVFMGRDTILAAKNSISIGDFTVIAPRCYIIDHEHGFAGHDIILNQKSVLKKVKIGRDCYLGAGTTILGGSIIGDGAIIGAGSVVTKDIPANQIWAGNPARFIKDR